MIQWRSILTIAVLPKDNEETIRVRIFVAELIPGILGLASRIPACKAIKVSTREALAYE